MNKLDQQTMLQIIKHKKRIKRRLGKMTRYSLASQKLHFDIPNNLARQIEKQIANKKYGAVLALLAINSNNINRNFGEERWS